MEHTFLSNLGYFLVFFAFVSAILSTVSYFLAVKNKNDLTLSALWKKTGRTSFRLHSIAMIGVVILLYILIYGHYYEFHYVWKYSNDSMPIEYLISCFWGGQEGSFLLWLFWNVVIGNILIRKAKEWESSVMTIFVLSQVFLNAMLLGVYVWDLKIGNNVFLLTKNLPDNIGLPWTEMSDYMKLPMFKDGQGLNPLLQNYWMTIHPPTLFLGFALTVVPFAYGIAGMWQNKFREWIKPSISWTFVGVGVLGIGILMGGMWAYEALSFGGFWAWDPVENVSYIPWLTFVGAGHLMLANQKKNNSIFFTYLLSILSFVLVLYSTFLTKSGILADTSVHSFTDNGMLGQLLLFIVFFLWLSVFVIIKNKQSRLMFTVLSTFLFVMSIFADNSQTILGINPSGIIFILGFLLFLVFVIMSAIRNFPKETTEEKILSREFWMFMGSLALLIACLQIFVDNSYPVWNTLFNTNNAGHEDVITYYNVWQGAFAVFIAFFVGFGQFLRYKNMPSKVFFKNISLSVIASIVISVIILVVYDFTNDKFIASEKVVYIALLFTSVYAVIGNLDYFIRFVRGKLNFAGASIAHIGFGLILFGALISNSQGKKLSHNRAGKFKLEALSDSFKNNEDAQLTLGDTIYVNRYFVSYQKRTQNEKESIYDVNYFEPIPLTYQKGDVVKVKSLYFEAKETHTVAHNLFLEETKNWKEIEKIDSVQPWKSHKAGEKLFTLNPFVQMNKKFGNVAEPATKHYLGHDVFTHIKYPDPSIFEGKNDGFMPYENYETEIGDSIFTTNGLVIVKQYQKVAFKKIIAEVIDLELQDYSDNSFSKNVKLVFMVKESGVIPIATEHYVEELDMKISMAGIAFPQYTKDSTLISPLKLSLDVTGKEYIIMQAKTFPLINLLWLGSVLMLIGSVMAAIYRMKRRKQTV